MSNTNIPSKAQSEIMDILYKNLQISGDEMNDILQKHRVKGNPEQLQRAFRLKLAQQFMASIKDTDGTREIFAYINPKTKKSVYIPIAFCDLNRLKAMSRRMHSLTTSLQTSSWKLQRGILRFDTYWNRFRGVTDEQKPSNQRTNSTGKTNRLAFLSASKRAKRADKSKQPGLHDKKPQQPKDF